MTSLLLKNFLYNRTVIAGILIILFAGSAGIFAGSRHLKKSAEAAAETIRYQQAHIDRNVKFFDKEMGLLLYYLRFAFINETDPLNGVNIGQRDVNNSIQFNTIRNLESQKYETDNYNPANLLAGNLDLGFVFIFLFPLFIISITYNLFSEESEGGTWKLAASQSNRAHHLLLKKLLIRASLVLVMYLVLMMMAVGVLSIAFSEKLVAVFVLLLLYFITWFAVCFWVVTWQKSSGLNAIALLSIWIMLTIISPAMVNNYISSRYPLPEAFATAVANREGFHKKWDLPKPPTMDQFYAHYPQFRKFKISEKEFSWLWYYAMQQAGDDDAAGDVNALNKKLQIRSGLTNSIAAFFPTLHTQVQLNRLSNSGLENHLQFMENAKRFHERLRMYFYPRIFSEAAVASENWKGFREEYFRENTRLNWTATLLPLVLIGVLFGMLSFLNIRRGLVVE